MDRDDAIDWRVIAEQRLRAYERLRFALKIIAKYHGCEVDSACAKIANSALLLTNGDLDNI